MGVVIQFNFLPNANSLAAYIFVFALSSWGFQRLKLIRIGNVGISIFIFCILSVAPQWHQFLPQAAVYRRPFIPYSHGHAFICKQPSWVFQMLSLSVFPRLLLVIRLLFSCSNKQVMFFMKIWMTSSCLLVYFRILLVVDLLLSKIKFRMILSYSI